MPIHYLHFKVQLYRYLTCTVTKLSISVERKYECFCIKFVYIDTTVVPYGVMKEHFIRLLYRTVAVVTVEKIYPSMSEKLKKIVSIR